MKLENALAASRDLRRKMDGRVYSAMIAGIESQMQELREQLKEYERLAHSKVLRLETVESLAEMLIKGRIARGYTQKKLAERLRIRPQQIQRYEATGYRAASLERILRVMKVLNLDLKAEIPLATAV
jgi:ribosome-binding protein aMBF1 (putative translation factor)